MSGGEIDRRTAERADADRRYNDALTRVDRALPQPPATAKAEPPIDLSAATVRDRAVILPPSLPPMSGWRERLAQFVWRLVAPVFTRQQEFNTAVTTQLDQMSAALRQIGAVLPEQQSGHRADIEAIVSFNSILVQYLQQITPFVDTKFRVVDASLDDVRMAAVAAQRAATAARHEIERMAVGHPAPTAVAAATAAALPAAAHVHAGGYVGFEDLFRGTQDEIRARQTDYADRFAGATNVVDLGCGRGEFLQLLRERGIAATGVDGNAEMVEACRANGLTAVHADALEFLNGLDDNSVGGLAALQVVEHLEPEYLLRLLDTAYAKLRPGATILLETINAACWVAYFESYIRDITHVRALHPDTLKFLVVAAGFERVDVHYRSPVAESGRLQRAPVDGVPPELLEIVRTINANVDRLNERLFTHLDFAVIGTKG